MNYFNNDDPLEVRIFKIVWLPALLLFLVGKYFGIA